MANFLAELKLHHVSRVAVHCAAALGVVVALGAAACAPNFADTAYAPYSGDGAAMLDGQAYVELTTGINGPINFRTCDGGPVFLAPALAFDAYVINSAAGDGFPLEVRAGPAAPFWRKSICDSQGRFTFSGVPAGDWIVVTQVKFASIVLTRNRGNVGTQMLARNVTLRPGQNAVAMTTRLVVGRDEFPGLE
jgi:hypothetical protein